MISPFLGCGFSYSELSLSAPECPSETSVLSAADTFLSSPFQKNLSKVAMFAVSLACRPLLSTPKSGFCLLLPRAAGTHPPPRLPSCLLPLPCLGSQPDMILGGKLHETGDYALLPVNALYPEWGLGPCYCLNKFLLKGWALRAPQHSRQPGSLACFPHVPVCPLPTLDPAWWGRV